MKGYTQTTSQIFVPPHNSILPEIDKLLLPADTTKYQSQMMVNNQTKNETTTRFRVKKQKYQSNPNIKGPTFALGREELHRDGILGTMKKTPGPGYYDSKLENPGLSYTIRTKQFDIYDKMQSKSPFGIYELTSLNRYGYYSLSKHKNSCATIFNDPKHSRFNYNFGKNPGPGQYDIPGGMNEKGIYYVSQYKNNLGWKMGLKSIEKRKNLF